MTLSLSIPETDSSSDLDRLLREFEEGSKGQDAPLPNRELLPQTPAWTNAPHDRAFSSQSFAETEKRQAAQRQAELERREAEISARERKAAEMETHSRFANDLHRAEAAVRNVSTEPPAMPTVDPAKLVAMNDRDYAAWKAKYLAAQIAR